MDGAFIFVKMEIFMKVIGDIKAKMVIILVVYYHNLLLYLAIPMNNNCFKIKNIVLAYSNGMIGKFVKVISN